MALWGEGLWVLRSLTTGGGEIEKMSILRVLYDIGGAYEIVI